MKLECKIGFPHWKDQMGFPLIPQQRGHALLCFRMSASIPPLCVNPGDCCSAPLRAMVILLPICNCDLQVVGSVAMAIGMMLEIEWVL